jgi:hypothetical protein
VIPDGAAETALRSSTEGRTVGKRKGDIISLGLVNWRGSTDLRSKARSFL